MDFPKTNYAYVDGSYNPRTKTYGCGGFLVDDKGVKHIIQKSGNKMDYVLLRNVAGELLGATEAVKLALKLGMKSLKIFYDYAGIEAWVTGQWKTKNPATKQYKMYMKNSGIALSFEHVKGHSGIPGNEEADILAKIAVGLLKKGKKVA